jgi:hypothetical protein
MGRDDSDEAIHRIRDFCTSRNAPAVLQATPTGRPYAPQLRPHAYSGAQGTHDTSAHHRANVERLRDTSEDTPHTPASLAESVPHNESAQAILAVPKDRYFASLLVFLYLSPAAPQPGPICARPFAIVTSLSVLSPPRPPGILSRASMLRDS